MAQIMGTADSKTIRSLACRQFGILVGTGLLITGISGLFAPPALPFGMEPTPDAGVAGPADGLDQGQSEAPLSPFAELTRNLATARARLQELARSTKEVAAERRELDALRTQERKVVAELRAVHADRSQLRDARDAAIARAEDLGEALEQATLISQALGKQLAAEHQENSRSRAREAQLLAQLDDLVSATALAEAELASLRGSLEDLEERLTDATQERVRAEAKLVHFEDNSAEHQQKITVLQAQISALEEELKAKNDALEGFSSLRTESDGLRHKLAATETDLKREEEENDRLSSELVMFRRAAKAATDLAQQHLLTVEGKISELSEVVNLTQPSERQSPGEPKAPPAFAPGASGDLIDARAQSVFSAESVDAPESPKTGKTEGYRLVAPVRAAEEPSDGSLQIRIRDALLKQREQLQGLMRDLDDGREGLR